MQMHKSRLKDDTNIKFIHVSCFLSTTICQLNLPKTIHCKRHVRNIDHMNMALCDSSRGTISSTRNSTYTLTQAQISAAAPKCGNFNWFAMQPNFWLEMEFVCKIMGKI